MCFQMVSIYNLETAVRNPVLLSFVVARMCSTNDFGEKRYNLPEQILFNFLALFPTLSSFARSKRTSHEHLRF